MRSVALAIFLAAACVALVAEGCGNGRDQAPPNCPPPDGGTQWYRLRRLLDEGRAPIVVPRLSGLSGNELSAECENVGSVAASNAVAYSQRSRRRELDRAHRPRRKGLRQGSVRRWARRRRDPRGPLLHLQRGYHRGRASPQREAWRERSPRARPAPSRRHRELRHRRARQVLQGRARRSYAR